MKYLNGIVIVVFLLVSQPFSQRVSVIEHISSSTCPPCANYNAGTFTPFLENSTHQGQYVVVSYRMNWPGTGDPYYTAEAGTRRTYYGVSTIPQVFINGTRVTTTGTAFARSFATANSIAPKVLITADHTITGTTKQNGRARITVTMNSAQNVTGAVLHAAVIEKRTTGNRRTNGETEFYHVMMKMIPNASGTPVNLQSGTVISITDSVSLAGTNIEDMNNIGIVAWLQITSTKEVLQAVESKAGTTSKPDAPSNLLVDASLSNLINVSWRSNSTGEDGFAIERKVGTQNFTQLAIVGRGVTNYSDTGITAGTYFYRVRAFTGTQFSDYSNEGSAVIVPVGINSITTASTKNLLTTTRTGIYLDNSEGLQGKVQLYNFQGRLILSRQFGSLNRVVSIPAEHFEGRLYICRVKMGARELLQTIR